MGGVAESADGWVATPFTVEPKDFHLLPSFGVLGVTFDLSGAVSIDSFALYIPERVSES